jgi:ubiquinol-cytochrome c reductase cytochrome b subunit
VYRETRGNYLFPTGVDVDVEPVLRKAGGAIDSRFRVAGYGRRAMRKAFPDHWSFFLGELALYSFIVLVITGVFLTFFFRPSTAELVYHGSYAKLDGVSMSEAFASTLRISFDVRGGLLVRQIHHWAALVFIAAVAAHALRIFFTGAFRKPREVNWIIGTAMFLLACVEGFAGYSLPDDLLSGTGVRIAEGIVLSVPVAGTYLAFFLFGGQYPGAAIVPRLYIAHVLLLPGLILALVTAHVMIIWHQGHTQWPGRRQREDNEVGVPTFPLFMLKTTALFMFVFGALALLGTVAQINPIWLFGPYNPAISSNGSQPDWYFAFAEGAMRLMPGAETNIAGHTIVWGVFLPAVILPFAFFLLMGGYPFFEQWVTGDRRQHQLLDRPRNMPTRTGIGVAVVAMAADLQLAAADDIIAFHFGVPVEDLVWVFRAGFFAFPLIALALTRHVCVSLQRADRRRLRLGTRYGIATLPASDKTAGDGTGGGDSPRDSIVGYAAVTRPASEDQRALLDARRPDELIIPIPRHLVPLPTPRRAAAQLRARLNHWYLISRLEPSGQDETGEKPAR